LLSSGVSLAIDVRAEIGTSWELIVTRLGKEWERDGESPRQGTLGNLKDIKMYQKNIVLRKLLLLKLCLNGKMILFFLSNNL